MVEESLSGSRPTTSISIVCASCPPIRPPLRFPSRPSFLPLQPCPDLGPARSLLGSANSGDGSCAGSSLPPAAFNFRAAARAEVLLLVLRKWSTLPGRDWSSFTQTHPSGRKLATPEPVVVFYLDSIPVDKGHESPILLGSILPINFTADDVALNDVDIPDLRGLQIQPHSAPQDSLCPLLRAQ